MINVDQSIVRVILVRTGTLLRAHGVRSQQRPNQNGTCYRLGKLVTRGIAIAAATATISTLSACSSGENSPKAISTNSTPSSTPSKASDLDTPSPSPLAIASPTPIAQTSVAVTPSPSITPLLSATTTSTIDYGGKTSREYWIVTDPDPQGVNCRWSSAIPKDWANPSAQFPRLNIQEWAVVRKFPKNTELKANNSPAGLITITDENGKPWLKVSIGDNDKICLVRANSQFIQPK